MQKDNLIYKVNTVTKEVINSRVEYVNICYKIDFMYINLAVLDYHRKSQKPNGQKTSSKNP